jgi:hypothetical protein
MIIANGTIEAKTKPAGGVDPATGYPLPNTGEGWGEPVPCQWRAVSSDNLGRTVSGNFVHLTASRSLKFHTLSSDVWRQFHAQLI